MTTQTLNILLKTKQSIKKIAHNQNIIKQFIIILLIWNLILSTLSILTVGYIIIKEYKATHIEYYLDEIPEYESL